MSHPITTSWLLVAVIAAACGGHARDVSVPEPEPEVVEPPGHEQPAPPPAEASLPRGFKSIEEMGEAFIDALNGGDPDVVAAFFPPDEVVNSAVQCTGPGGALEEIHEEREEILGELPSYEMMEFEWIGLVPRKGEEEVLEVGEVIDDCTVIKPITVKKVEARFWLTQGGKTMEESEKVTVARFGSDGLWFVVEL